MSSEVIRATMEKLADALIADVAKKLSIPKPDATKSIIRCAQIVSIEHDVDLKDVYAIINTPGVFKACLKEDCSDLDLEECEKSCSCAVFEEKCISRKIDKFEIINVDPDRYAQGLTETALQQLVKVASFLYYNYDGGGLDDNAYDALEYHLRKKLHAKGRMFEKIGAEPIEKLRAPLPYPMASLNKMYPTNPAIIPWIGASPEIVWSLKLDGVSGMVVFKKVKGSIIPVKIFTRGDGTTGGDVTYLKDYIKLPTPTEEMVVRGEFVLTRRDWNEKYSKEYANARAFVSAKINSGFISVALPDIHFVAYEIVSGPKYTQSQGFKYLEAEGFHTPEYGVLLSPTLFTIANMYKQKRSEAAYFIDGLVLAYNIISSVGEKVVNPMYKIAFKMLLDEQIRSTTITGLEWNISRLGRYVPVATYQAVFINGSRLTRASAHNAAWVRDNQLGLGTKVQVARAGDVIPQIKQVIVNPSIDPTYPKTPLQGGYDWTWRGRDIVLINIDDNPEVQVQRILYFFQTLGVPGLGEGRINSFYKHGYTTVQSIARASIDNIMGVRGFGKVLGPKIYNNIHDVLATTRFDRYIAATSFFPGLGRVLWSKILRGYPDIFEDAIKDNGQQIVREKLKIKKISDIGEKRQLTVVEGIPRLLKFMMDLSKDDTLKAIEANRQRRLKLEKEGRNKHIEGKNFVLTGFYNWVDYELEEFIEDNNGRVASAVDSTTSAVIAASIANVTDKMTMASQLNVPVYTVQEFVKKFNIPHKLNVPDTDTTNPDDEVEMQLQREMMDA